MSGRRTSVPMTGAERGRRSAGTRIEAVGGRAPGMGVVYRARQLALDRTVALKLIAPEFARDDAFRARFERESRIAASLDHPNVIPVYEAGSDGRSPALHRDALRRRHRSWPDARGRRRPRAPARGRADRAGRLRPRRRTCARARAPRREAREPARRRRRPEHAYLADFGVQHAGVRERLTKHRPWVGHAGLRRRPSLLDGRARGRPFGRVRAGGAWALQRGHREQTLRARDGRRPCCSPSSSEEAAGGERRSNPAAAPLDDGHPRSDGRGPAGGVRGLGPGGAGPGGGRGRRWRRGPGTRMMHRDRRPLAGRRPAHSSTAGEGEGQGPELVPLGTGAPARRGGDRARRRRRSRPSGWSAATRTRTKAANRPPPKARSRWLGSWRRTDVGDVPDGVTTNKGP